MWRLCDLHVHTSPNEQCLDPWDAAAFVRSRIVLGLDVVAVTDHDHSNNVADAIQAAEGTSLTVIAGVELSTVRGHMIVLAPDPDGPQTIRDFLNKLDARPNQQVDVEDMLTAATTIRTTGNTWGQQLVFIGAHVDTDGSMLASAQSVSLPRQLQLAARLHALEVNNDATRAEWSRAGVKQGPKMTLVRASDTHDSADQRLLATWLYLPDLSAPSFHHALALRESSVSLADAAPSPPAYAIESMTFSGGHHDGIRLDFCERANAIIGPPNSGKSLVVDAIKFVFGIESDLAEVEAISASRMAKCLPTGSTVEIVVRTPSGSVPLSRTIGARAPAVPFRPVVFSQTELTRRAGEPAPAIELLDLHVADAARLKGAIDDAAARVATLLQSVLTGAKRASGLRTSVNNPVDGLSATETALRDLAGAEEVARLAGATTSTANWRQRVREETARWRDETTPTTPTIPQQPTVDESVAATLGRFAPKDVIDAAITEASDAATAAVNTAAAKIIDALTSQEDDFAATQSDIEQQLTDAGFTRGSEVELKLGQLRTRLSDLQSESQQLNELDATVNQGLVDLKSRHDEALAAREQLTAARKLACQGINQSMRSFFARVDTGSVTTNLDGLIDDLKTGTFMRADTRHDLRESLDRFAILEVAVRRNQGLAPSGSASEQDRVVDAALSRGRLLDLARIACLWPGDSLVLAMLGESGTPTPFTELTEGLRALAIKEISFAASDLPVITDQPEDAVPTRSVFENLVPTLREQRQRRQFIVVSHDANIVVASDVERITVLQANDDKSPHTGGLFDERVRDAALEHLEGGRLAFRLRADRYAAMGAQRED
jgi:hypothetical protein